MPHSGYNIGEKSLYSQSVLIYTGAAWRGGKERNEALSNRQDTDYVLVTYITLYAGFLQSKYEYEYPNTHTHTRIRAPDGCRRANLPSKLYKNLVYLYL